MALGDRNESMCERRRRTGGIVQFVIDALYAVVDLVVDIHHSPLDAVSDPRLLRRCHPSFFLCQLVQLLQTVLDVCVSDQLRQVPF